MKRFSSRAGLCPYLPIHDNSETSPKLFAIICEKILLRSDAKLQNFRHSLAMLVKQFETSEKKASFEGKKKRLEISRFEGIA